MTKDMKVKVKTADLLAALREVKAKEDKAVAKSKAELPAKTEAYRVAVVQELRRAADKIERGGAIPTARYGDAGIRFKAELPKAYERDSTLARAIKSLEMAADDAIIISATDYARYLA